ncbi:ATP-dependent zinc protease family protein [Zhongshania sp. BJYM1]|uniref:ATP-dependent zinc protease family protein n=1 Tax=Zhongshania aquatica TaxID=2965069 RepID=UPI0022B4AB0D|nr:ATP-dependent zinc protease [Marortus sp. BJYM1]
MAQTILGWREWISLPDLAISGIKAKIDTGARSSSLHAIDIQKIDIDGEAWVEFKVNPLQHQNTDAVPCKARIKDYRQVTDSGGHRSMRYVIETTITIGSEQFTAEMTLADRSQMMFRMLLGRTAMKNRYTVDPGRSYCASKKPPRSTGTI